jgi:hypothetical protein
MEGSVSLGALVKKDAFIRSIMYNVQICIYEYIQYLYLLSWKYQGLPKPVRFGVDGGSWLGGGGGGVLRENHAYNGQVSTVYTS